MEANPEQCSFLEKDKIAILLAEYNTLRNEILLTTSTLFQSIGFASAALIGLLTFISSRSEPTELLLCLVDAPLLFIAFAVVWVDHTKRKIACRLRDLEREINTRAGGERLMIWETVNGWGGLLYKERRGEMTSRQSN